MKVKRPIVIKGDLAYIQLTRGYTAVIDAADVHIVDEFNWVAKPHPRNVYAYSSFPVGNGKRRGLHLHRLIMGVSDGTFIDHKDCDGLNCRRNNMRVATISQNGQNQRKRIDNTSGFKGVFWNKQRSNWQGRITINSVSTYIGSFHTPEDAHSAYVKASAELHGEFGRVE